MINFMEYQNLKKAYSVIRSTIYSGIDFGDSDEDKVTDLITLGDIRDFIEIIRNNIVFIKKSIKDFNRFYIPRNRWMIRLSSHI